MREWKKHKIEELILLEYGKSLGNYRESEGTYPVYGTNGRIGSTNLYLSPIPSIIIGRKGAYRGVQFSKQPFYVIDTAFYAKPRTENIDLLFLYNFFLTLDIDAMDSGSAIPSTDRHEIYDIDILLPPLPEQRAIAGVLSSLDDKIDLLHRQNKTLEGIASALWRKMFIEDADPKWKRGKLGDLFVLHRGYDLPVQNRTEGKYAILSASGISGFHHEYKAKGPGVVTGRSGLLGKVFFITRDFWPLNTALYVSEFRIGTPLFSYFLLKTIDLEGLNGGSAVPTLNRNDVHSIETSLPNKEEIYFFESQCSSFYEKIDRNTIHIHSLGKVRDTLLPKLMSGEVRVKL